MHLCIYASMHPCIHASMHPCMHACMHVCMYVCLYVCMSVYLYVCMSVCICMYVCMHACMYVYILAHGQLNKEHDIYIYGHIMKYCMGCIRNMGDSQKKLGKKDGQLNKEHVTWRLNMECGGSNFFGQCRSAQQRTMTMTYDHQTRWYLQIPEVTQGSWAFFQVSVNPLVVIWDQKGWSLAGSSH